MWYELSQIGVKIGSGWQQNRNTILCNRVSAILSFFTVSVFIAAFSFFGFIISVKLALVSSLTFLIPIWFNYKGWVVIEWEYDIKISCKVPKNDPLL